MPLKVNNQEHTVKYPQNSQEIRRLLLGIVKQPLVDNDFTINLDGSVSVHTSVTICNIRNGLLPIPFKEVKGNFSCIKMGLKSLKGCPEIIHGDFDCSENKLTDLKHCPKIVKKEFRADQNKIREVLWLPEEITALHLADNKIKTFKLTNQRFPLLTDVDLSNNQLCFIHNSFDLAPNIEYLNLTSNVFANQSQMNFLYKLPNLTELNLGQNLLKAINVKKNPKLFFLNLHENDIQNIEINSPDLRILCLKNNSKLDIKKVMNQINLTNCSLLCDVQNIEEKDLLLLMQKNPNFYAEHLLQINNLYRKYINNNRNTDSYDDIIDIINIIKKRLVIIEKL